MLYQKSRRTYGAPGRIMGNRCWFRLFFPDIFNFTKRHGLFSWWNFCFERWRGFQLKKNFKNAAVPRPPSIVLTVLLGAEKFTTGGKKFTNKYGDSHYITETPDRHGAWRRLTIWVLITLMFHLHSADWKTKIFYSTRNNSQRAIKLAEVGVETVIK